MTPNERKKEHIVTCIKALFFGIFIAFCIFVYFTINHEINDRKENTNRIELLKVAVYNKEIEHTSTIFVDDHVITNDTYYLYFFYDNKPKRVKVTKAEYEDIAENCMIIVRANLDFSPTTAYTIREEYDYLGKGN